MNFVVFYNKIVTDDNYTKDDRNMRGKYYKTAAKFVAVSLILLLCFNTDIIVCSTDDTMQRRFYSAKDGSFFITYGQSRVYYLYRILQSGRISLIDRDGIKIDSVYCENKHIYEITQTENNVLLSDASQINKPTVFLNNIHLKNNCLAVDFSEVMYAVDIDDPCVVRIFDYKGLDIDRYKVSGSITKLFLDTGTNNVYAVSSSGVFNVTSKSRLSSAVPYGEFEINGGLCTDEKGNVFTFEPINGFSKKFSTDYDLICPASDYVYGVRDKTIYRLDINGDETAYINIGVKPDKLLSSKDNLAYTVGNSISILKISDMTAMPQKQDGSSSPKSDGSEVSHPVEQSHTEHNYSISSNTVEISGEYIFLNEPMTLAKLKKAIEYNDNILTVRNHNGRSVTSGNVGTNWELTFSGAEEKIFYTVVPGDITGEGNINSRDIKALSEYLLDISELYPSYLFAADTDQNGTINLLDLYMLYKST